VTPLSFVEFIQIIAWILALIVISVGLYILVIEIRNPIKRVIGILLVVLAVNTILIVEIQSDTSLLSAYPVYTGLAVTRPLIIGMLFLLTVLISQQRWFSPKSGGIEKQKSLISALFDPKRNWLLYSIVCLPIILAIIDLMSGSHIFITEIKSTTNFGGFLYESEIARGPASQIIDLLFYGLFYFASLSILVVDALKKETHFYSEKRTVTWLLFVVFLLVGGVNLFLQLLPYPAIFLLICNGILTITILVINMLPISHSIRAPGGSIRMRLVASVMMVAAPVLLIMFFLISLFLYSAGELFFQGPVVTGETGTFYWQRFLIGMVTGALLILLVFISFIFQRMLTPLITVTQVAKRILGVETLNPLQVNSNDEFNMLAGAINHLLVKIREVTDSRDFSIHERTSALERRSKSLYAVSQIVREAGGIRDIQRLYNEIPKMISKYIEKYDIDLYILDDIGEYAILQSTNNEAGLQLLANSYKAVVGHTDNVGYVASVGKPRIVQNPDQNEGGWISPNSSQSRSEITLPMNISGKVIGVIDVHSNLAAAFANEDLEIFQILADQIALAIDNARKLSQLQESAREFQETNNRKTLHNWRQRSGQRKLAYRYNRVSVDAFEDSYPVQTPSNAAQGYQLEVPITLDGQTLGSLILRREADQPKWTEEDLSLAVDAVNQVIPALERARMIEEIEQHASLERLVNKFSNQIQKTLDQSSVMRNTVQELSQVVDATRIRFRLAKPTKESSEESFPDSPIESDDEPLQEDDTDG
jgi:GAF domain-containing protein